MIKRKKGIGLGVGGRNIHRQGFRDEDVNPMETTANLADAMLVLAVGMMLAVIINWNVELNTVVDVDEIDASNMSDKQVQQVNDNQNLKEKGTVYQDPATGKYYIKVEE